MLPILIPVLEINAELGCLICMGKVEKCGAVLGDIEIGIRVKPSTGCCLLPSYWEGRGATPEVYL